MPESFEFAPYETASPLQLARQPVSIEDKGIRLPDEDWETEYTHYEQRLANMKSWRYGWWQHWAKLAEYLLPSQYWWLVTANLAGRRGNMINQAIVDSTATWAMEIAASGFVAGTMPTTRPWFKFGCSIPGYVADQKAKIWFDDAQKSLETVLAQSNFYDEMSQAAKNLTTFGTQPVLMYEDAEDVLRCYTPACGEYYLAVGARNSVDTMYTEETMTVAQIVERFLLENCPDEVQEMWETGGGSLETEFVVARAIEPNFAIVGRGKTRGMEIQPVPSHFVYREVWWLRGRPARAPLSRRGFIECPFAVARWSKTSNSPYAQQCPGMDALGDTMQLQIETRRKAEAIEKKVRPPMGAHPSLKEQPASTNPGHITYIDTSNGKEGFWSLFEVNIDLADLKEDLKEIQGRIERCFLVDVFQVINQMEGVQPRNVVEITQRVGEKLQRLGPVIGLWKTEFAERLIPRALNIMRRRGLLKPLPNSLRDATGRELPLKIDYIDMVTLAQRGAQTASMERTFQIAGNLSQAAKAAGVADPLRRINLDKSIEVYAELVDFPESCLYGDAEVAQHDQARAKQAQAAQAQQQGLAAVQAAQGLSNTKLGGGSSALDLLMGNQGSPTV